MMTDDGIIQALRLRVAQGRPTDQSWAPKSAPATTAAVDEAEQVIGYPPPPLLRRVYLEVANGGVGPSGGIEGLPGGYARGGDMFANYVSYRTAELDPGDPPAPPNGLLFICDYGCAAWALVDCRQPRVRCGSGRRRTGRS